MNSKSIIWIALVALGLFAAIFYFVGNYFANVKEVDQRNLVEAQVEVRDAVYDNTWKKIAQSFDIAESGKDGFKDVYIGYMEARAEAYGEGGSLMQWIQEQVPEGDILQLFGNAQRIMEDARDELTHEQKKLADYNREHKNIIGRGWTSWFVGDRELVEFEMITSTRTREAAQTGIDDDVSLGTNK